MADERIGRLSVDVSPEFDQAELFRQVKAATANLPKIDLKVNITVKEVNKAIREVNGKKLLAIKPPVQITALAVNKAIREVNRKKLAPLKIPVELDDKTLLRFDRQLKRTNKTAQAAQSTLGQLAANALIVGSAFRLIRISAIVTALGFFAQAISAATALVGSLASSLSVGLVGGLSTAGIAVGSLVQGMGVLSFALSGVSDALGGLNEELDADKLLALTPAAQSFVRQLDAMKPAARGAQQAIQEQLFGGLSQALRIVTPLLDDFVGPLQQTADIIGDLSVDAARLVNVFSGSLQTVLVINNILLEDLGTSGLNFAAALVDIYVAAGPIALAFSNLTRTLSVTVRNFITAAKRSGDLADFFELAGVNLRVLLSIIGNSSRILVNVFRAALPFGFALIDQIETITDRLADVTGGRRGQSALRTFFSTAMPAIEEFGRLLRDVGIEFAQLAEQPGLRLLLESIRTELLPAVSQVIQTLTSEFGPVLIQTFTALALLFTDLAGASGPLNSLVFVVGLLAQSLHTLFTEYPNTLKVVQAFFLLEAGLAAVSLQILVFRASGLGAIIGAITQSLLGARGLIPSLQALGNLLRTGAGFARFAGFVGIVITVMDIAIRTFDQFFIRLRNGEGIASSFFNAFSFAVISSFQDILKAMNTLIEGFGGLAKTLSVLPGPAGDIGKALEASGAGGAVSLNGLIKKLDQYKSAVAAVEPVKTFGPPVPADLAAQKDIEKRVKDFSKLVQKETGGVQDSLGQATTGFKDVANVAVPSMDSIKDSIDPAQEATERLNRSLETSRDRLSRLGDVVERQRSLVDGLKDALDSLKNAQLEGTQAFDDARFALDQQIKSLQLQQVNLRLTGVADEDPAIKALEDQIARLRLEADKTDLTESLQLEPLRRQFEKTVNPIKEIAFNDAITQFANLSKQHEVESDRLLTLQKRYNTLNDAIKRIDETASRITSSTRGITAGLSQAVAAPAVIQKPLAQANASLKTSTQAISRNAINLRTGLTKPIRQAGMDINILLGRIPSVAAPGATELIRWMRAIGTTAGNSLVGGLMDGIRSQLQPESDFYKLLHEEIPDFIRKNKGPVSFDQTILVPAGVAIMDGLTTGLRRGFEPVKGFLNDVGPSMEEFVPDSVFGKKTAEFLVEVAAGKKPDPSKFFKDLVPDPVSVTGGIADPRLGFLHKTLSLADTMQMAASLAKTFGVAVTSVFRPGAITSSGNPSDHGFGLAADLSNGSSPTPQMDALAKALKPLFGTIVKQLIWRDRDQNRGFPVPGHMNHVHVAFLPAPGFSLHSGKIGKSAAVSGPFAPFFAAASQMFGVPAELLMAVTKAESGFNPRAGSPAGAKGLMQLMPATFASLNVGSNIFDPKQNIFAGAKYLSQQLKTFKDVRLALAAYNAGPGNATTALRSFGETIAYVARVLGFLKSFGGFREHGGGVRSDKGYWVGEAGPEWFEPRQSGHITSNRDMMKTLQEQAMLLREIRDTGGLRQQTTNIATASRDPETLLALMEIEKRKRLKRLDLA